MPSFKLIALSALVVAASAQPDNQRMITKVKRQGLPAGLSSLPVLDMIPLNLPLPDLSLLGGSGGPNDVLGGLLGGEGGGGPLAALTRGAGPLSSLTGILSGGGSQASSSEGELTKRNLADLFAPVKDVVDEVGNVKRQADLASPLAGLTDPLIAPLAGLTKPLAGLTAPLAGLPLVGQLTGIPILGPLLGGAKE
ncbi:hypothetical protein RQP46_002832 [Phenoliferia psychrophenolica]